VFPLPVEVTLDRGHMVRNCFEKYGFEKIVLFLKTFKVSMRFYHRMAVAVVVAVVVAVARILQIKDI
jgi:hypothetical protein